MDLADEALKMTGALAAVVVLLMGGLFILKRFMGESSANVGGPIVRLLGGLRLGQGKAIMLVEVAGEVLVLGSTARDLTLLSRVEDVERIEKLRAMSCGTVGQLGAWASGWWGGTRRHSLGIEGKNRELMKIMNGIGRLCMAIVNLSKGFLRVDVLKASGRFICQVGIVCMGIGLGASAFAQAPQDPVVSLQLSGGQDSEPWTIGIRILFLLTVLTLAPALLTLVTSFTRVVIVLGLLRQAMGTLHAPPNQVVIGLALFLTMFIMMPVWEQIRVEALNPYLEEQITQEVALEHATSPIREFMMRQVREKDLGLFMEMSGVQGVEGLADVPLHVLIPAFVTSELRTAFQIGFLIYVPFLVIDMIVASILMSMGMMLLPPIMISLPFKLVLFVLADGWFLVIGSLMKSFN